MAKRSLLSERPLYFQRTSLHFLTTNYNSNLPAPCDSMCTNSQKQQLHKENISLFLRPYTRMGQVVVCSTSTESMKEGNTYE